MLKIQVLLLASLVLASALAASSANRNGRPVSLHIVWKSPQKVSFSLFQELQWIKTFEFSRQKWERDIFGQFSNTVNSSSWFVSRWITPQKPRENIIITDVFWLKMSAKETTHYLGLTYWPHDYFIFYLSINQAPNFQNSCHSTSFKKGSSIMYLVHFYPIPIFYILFWSILKEEKKVH